MSIIYNAQLFNHHHSYSAEGWWLNRELCELRVNYTPKALRQRMTNGVGISGLVITVKRLLATLCATSSGRQY